MELHTIHFRFRKDGWTITHDPFPLQIGKKRLSPNLGAERLIIAERGLQQIVVEVKSFVGHSNVKDLEPAGAVCDGQTIELPTRYEAVACSRIVPLPAAALLRKAGVVTV